MAIKIYRERTFDFVYEAAVRQHVAKVIILTTFGGLAPIIMETSRQAKALIPMAISIGFGSIFATMITLIFIPSLYVAIDDLNKYLAKKK